MSLFIIPVAILLASTLILILALELFGKKKGEEWRYFTKMFFLGICVNIDNYHDILNSTNRGIVEKNCRTAVTQKLTKILHLATNTPPT